MKNLIILTMIFTFTGCVKVYETRTDIGLVLLDESGDHSAHIEFQSVITGGGEISIFSKDVRCITWRGDFKYVDLPWSCEH